MRACGVQRMISRSLNVPGSRLVGVAAEIVRLAVARLHERPLQAGREAGAAAAAQPRVLDVLDDRRAASCPAPSRAPRSRRASSSRRACAPRRRRSTSTGPTVSLGWLGCGYPITDTSARMPGTFSGVTDSMKSSLTMTGVAKPQAPRHSTSITVNLPSGLVAPSSPQSVCFEQRLHHVLRAADVAGRRGADLDEVPADRMLVVHRVERHDALHVRRRQLEHLRHLGHRRLR